jgi:membrane fusion protein (multidrug efflux system)
VDPLHTSIPLQHGLPGSVEVQVEEVSPAVLVLRTAGQLAASPKTPFGTDERQ